jgi:cytochrome c5
MLKPFLLVSAVVLFAISTTPSMGGSPQAANPAPVASSGKGPVKPTAESQAKAKRIYEMDCALCHGDNGNGQTDVGKSVNLSSDWTNPATLAGKQDDALFQIIRNGKGNMPSEAEGRADNTVVSNIIIYIRGLSKGQAAAPQAAAPEAK